jgi:hypothetical protein
MYNKTASIQEIHEGKSFFGKRKVACKANKFNALYNNKKFFTVSRQARQGIIS